MRFYGDWPFFLIFFFPNLPVVFFPPFLSIWILNLSMAWSVVVIHKIIEITGIKYITSCNYPFRVKSGATKWYTTWLWLYQIGCHISNISWLKIKDSYLKQQCFYCCWKSTLILFLRNILKVKILKDIEFSLFQYFTHHSQLVGQTKLQQSFSNIHYMCKTQQNDGLTFN